jgi:hypothetical protein
MTGAFEAAPSLVPPSYRGREQAWIKHQLLESYLEKRMLIVGMAIGTSIKLTIIADPALTIGCLSQPEC